MRIIGGSHRGRAIHVPGTSVRPTADRVREAVFNILAHGIDWDVVEDAHVLDLYAGTGAYGLEALSRGAARATFVDIDAAALSTIRRNAAALGEGQRIALLKLDARRLPLPPGAAGAAASLAFIDAPYGSGLSIPTLQLLASRRWLSPGAIAVVEIGERETLMPLPGYREIDKRIYGAAQIVLLRFGAAEAAGAP